MRVRIVRLWLKLLVFVIVLPKGYAQERFDSDTVFDKLQEITFAKSPDVQVAQSNLRQKQAARYTSWTAWAPRLDLKIAYTTSKDYSALTSGSLGVFAEQFKPSEVGLSSYQLVARAPIYSRSVHVGVERAQAELELAQTENELARAQVAWNLRQLFGDLLLRTYKVAMVKRSIELAKSNLREAQLRFRLGSRTVIDVLKAQAQLSQFEAQQVTYDSEQTQAFNKLSDYTGLSVLELEALGLVSIQIDDSALFDEIEKFAETKTLLSEIRSYPLDREALSNLLMRESGVLRRIREQAAIESKQAKTLVANEWPELSAQASLSKQSEVWGRTLSTGETSYSYGLVLNIPLFAFGRGFSLNREAGEVMAVSEIRMRRSTEELLSTIQNLVLRGQALIKSVESLRIGVERNTEIERLTSRSYQLGKSTFLDLQLAQNDLVEAKVQLAQAQVDLAVLVWQIKWNLGTVENSK